MRKWIMRFTIIIIVIMLLKSHHGLIDSTSNFMIDGVVPLTNWAVGGFLSTVLIGFGTYFTYKTVSNLRFEMLKRRAILYTEQQHKLLLANKTQLSPSRAQTQVEDLELAHNSL